MINHIIDSIKGKHPLTSRRASQWGKIRENHLKIQPYCALCGGHEKIQVHHIHPFHIHPELELDPDNLITLCESEKHGINCHLFFGHLGNFKNVNETVVEDVSVWSKKLKPTGLLS